VVEGLSPEARAHFAAGGLGILIGDGQLNYRPEQILEAYYAYSLNKSATLTFDYQFPPIPDTTPTADRFRFLLAGFTRNFEVIDAHVGAGGATPRWLRSGRRCLARQ
jgi:hypothetical protein